MSKIDTPAAHLSEQDRRAIGVSDRPLMAGVTVRPDDIEPTVGLHRVAKLFRGMAGLILLLMASQVFFGLTGGVDISYGVLFAEAVRLAIFAGLLWGAGDLSDLYVKSHYDLRATRILVSRVCYRLGQLADRLEADADEDDPGRGKDAGRQA